MTYLLDVALQHGIPLLLVGPTGTGKSTYVGKHLLTGLPQDAWMPVNITLSARTSANMTQDQVRRGGYVCVCVGGAGLAGWLAGTRPDRQQTKTVAAGCW